MTARRLLRVACVVGVTIAATGAGTPRAARSQALDGLPSPAPRGDAAGFVLEHLEAPEEIALGTMAVNVWARVTRGPAEPEIASMVLVWPGEGEEKRIEMRPVDGAFDSTREEAVATVDTYAWTRDGTHEFEIRVVPATGVPHTIGRGAVRVKNRISTPDLFLFDDRGTAHPWLGSGAGGFTAGDLVETGPVAATPLLADFDGDRLVDLLLPGETGDVLLCKNRGAGRFESVRSIACGDGLVAAVVGDLDGDGKLDLVTATRERALEVRLALAAEATQRSMLTLAPDLLELADLDGDGRPEIHVALLGLQDGEVQVWTRASRSDPSWAPSRRLSPGAGGRGRVRGLRASPDGKTLWVLSSNNGEATLESWSGGADTKSGSEPVLGAVVRVPGEPIALVIGRFREDGKASCLVATRREGGIALHEIRGEAAFERLSLPDPGPTAFAALDLDGDGDDDLVTGGVELRVWINVQGGAFREAGESPYLLELPVAALVSGSLDERGS